MNFQCSPPAGVLDKKAGFAYLDVHGAHVHERREVHRYRQYGDLGRLESANRFRAAEGRGHIRVPSQHRAENTQGGLSPSSRWDSARILMCARMRPGGSRPAERFCHPLPLPPGSTTCNFPGRGRPGAELSRPRILFLGGAGASAAFLCFSRLRLCP